jgi:hypothetical protein
MISGTSLLKLYVSITLAAFVFASCGKFPTSVGDDRETGSLELRTCVFKNGLSKDAAAAGIGLCDSLIIEIMDKEVIVFRSASLFDCSAPISSRTLNNVPVGADQEVRIFTVDKSGSIIHLDSISHRSVRIEPQTVTVLTVMLIPAVGSIFLQLENIPTPVDSVFATFAAGSGQPWAVRAKRASKMYLSLEKIPHKTHGLLKVAAVNSTKDTLYSALNEITFNACAMENIVLNFSSAPGQISFDMGVVLPGITSVSGSITVPETDITESGDLLITEIMYAANDSEYIEVYNPGDVDRSYDTLIIEIDGTMRFFSAVNIPAKQTYVFGRKALPWADAYHPTASALDLSGGGNWITVRDKSGFIFDRVIFTGTGNTQEWPSVTGKQSIALDAEINDAKLNNFGRNWKAATDLIAGTAAQYGTPHAR